MPRDCTCPKDGSSLCGRCAAYAARAGVTTAPRQQHYEQPHIPPIIPRPAVLDEAMPEGTFLAKIRSVAKAHGWLTYHVFDARRSEVGFPDLVLTNGTSVLIYELKTNTGKVTKEQADWLALFAHTGKVECGTWRPRDFPAIVERLSRKEEPAL